MEFYQGKQVVVTGGTGFVGGHFVRALIAHGARVRVPIHIRPICFNHQSIEVITADLTRPEECRRALQNASYVIHCAGAVSAAGVTTGTNPMSAITTNLILTAQVIEAAWAVGVKRLLVFSSSTGYPVTNHPVREEEMWSGPPHPTYLGYGWMRRYIERMSEFTASRSPVKIALARPTAVYGEHDDFNPETSHVIPALIRRAVEKQDPYIVWGTGQETRDFLHINDFVRGCLLLLEKHADCDPVNIGYGKHVTISEIVAIILRAAGHTPSHLLFDSSKPVTIPHRMVDVSKSSRLLGFQPNISIEDGLTRTVKWYLDNISHGKTT